MGSGNARAIMKQDGCWWLDWQQSKEKKIMTSTLTKARGSKRTPQPEPRELPAKERDDRPWRQYRHEPNWRLLEPGFAGFLSDAELAFIIKHLEADLSLRAWWGMPARWKGIPKQVIKRLALEGSPENLSFNRTLARPRRPSRAAA
jgi:hypothetical protein